MSKQPPLDDREAEKVANQIAAEFGDEWGGFVSGHLSPSTVKLLPNGYLTASTARRI